MKLKDYLDDNDIAYNKAARRIGVSAIYFGNIVRGTRKPSMKLAKQIEEYTGGEIKWHELLEDAYTLEMSQ